MVSFAKTNRPKNGGGHDGDVPPRGVHAQRRGGREHPLGGGVSAGAVSDPDKDAHGKTGEWRSRPLARERPHVFVDGTHMKRSWGGAYESVAVLVAIGAGPDGFREAMGVGEGHGEGEDGRGDFFIGLRGRGLRGVRMAAGDKSAGMLGALARVFPDALCRRRAARFHGNVLAKVPKRRRSQVAAQPEATRAQEDTRACARKAREVIEALRTPRLADAARIVEEGLVETPAYARFRWSTGGGQDEQRRRAPRPRDKEADQGGRQLPGRQGGHDARGCEARVHSRRQLGIEEVPGRQPAGRLG